MYDISIIVPCYNAGKFLDLLIKDVLSQKISVQLILVDDGSKDNTKKVVNEYLDKIEYIHTENLGAGHARNVGIKRAQADWIIFLDSDDLLYYNSLDYNMLDFLNQCKKNNIQVIYTAKSKTDINLEREVIVTYPEERIENNMPLLEFWTCIYNRNFLLENEILFFEYREQDVETAFRYRVFSRAENIIKNNKIFFYLQRDNCESNTHTLNEYVLYKVKSMVYYQLLLESGSDQEFLRDTTTHFALCFFRICLNSDKSRTQIKADKKTIKRIIKSINNNKKRDFSCLKDYYKYWLKYLISIVLYYVPPFLKKRKKNIPSEQLCMNNDEDLYNRLIRLSPYK